MKLDKIEKNGNKIEPIRIIKTDYWREADGLKKYYGLESSSSAQEQPPNFSNQNLNSQNQDLNLTINEHLSQSNNYHSLIFPNFSQETNCEIENPQANSFQNLFLHIYICEKKVSWALLGFEVGLHVS